MFQFLLGRDDVLLLVGGFARNLGLVVLRWLSRGGLYERDEFVEQLS